MTTTALQCRRQAHRRDNRGFSMLELIVVVAAVVILAAALAPMTLTWIDDGKLARAAADSATVGAAINRFFQDTSRWPGQAEILEAGSAIRFLSVGTPTEASYPVVTNALGIGPATCSSGLSGVQTNVTSFANVVPSPLNTLDITAYLLTPPDATRYPHWQGPYLSVDLLADPWGSVYVINMIPLFCAEVVTELSPAGALGYAWILSGGPNRLIQTPFTVRRVSADSDDVGVVLGKRMDRAIP